ncbi:MAG TPA: M24 family metallopeptidase [Acidobacteriota bacterium]|nr:M24 family metallopeptidase [Acidobacteriota bacterium]
MNRKEELNEKTAKVRRLLKSLDLKAVLLKKQSTYSWLTAGGMNMINTNSEIGVSSLLITEKAKYVLTSRIESPRAMEEEKLGEFGFELMEYDWFEPRELELLKSVVPDLNVGCDIDTYGLKNVDAELKRLRYSLMPEERERYLWFGNKLSEAIETVMVEAPRNCTEAELTGELTRRLWKHRIDQVGFQAGSDERAYKYKHPIPTEKKIDKHLLFNVMARKWGLTLTITRMMSFGKVTTEIREQFNDNLLIENSMIAATRPGAVSGDIFQMTCDLYDKLGYIDEWRRHHQGGSAGYELRDYICTRETKEVVQDDQAFCWNPSISGTKTEDTFIVRGDGVEFVTKPMVFPTQEQTVNGLKFIRPGILER